MVVTPDKEQNTSTLTQKLMDLAMEASRRRELPLFRVYLWLASQTKLSALTAEVVETRAAGCTRAKKILVT